MFGSGSNSGFGGFGANNNNQQQQQPNPGGTGSVFGGGGGFGQPAGGTGFGTTGNAFGSNPTNNAFGSSAGSGFGGTSSGGFGSNTAAPAFGAAKPAFGSTGTTGGLFGSNNTGATNTSSSGFGGFGSTGNTSGGAFGSGTANPSTGGGGLFGAAKPFGAAATSAPASGGGLFGTAPAAGGGFGATSNPSFGANQPPAQGTANPPYQAHQEKEPGAGTTNHYQTISFMPAYKNFSLEELRLQDYAQGRRYGNESGQTGAFGFNTGFGTGAANNTATSGFGTNTGTTGGGLFGSGNTNNNQSAGFGTSGGFGANNAATSSGGGLFGKPATTGLFGSNNTTTNTGGTGLFGSGTPGAATGTGTGGAFGGGGFGSNTPAAGSGGLFGNSNNNQPQNKPFSFNTGATGGTGFGGTGTGFGATNTAGTGTGPGLFGNNNQQSGAGGFGAQNTGTGTGFGTGGGFGTNNPQQPAAPFSSFGANQNQQQNKPAFGFNTTPTQPSTGGGLFNNQSNQNANTGGLFGSKPAFGAAAAASAPPAGGSLFGAPTGQTNTGGGLFGTQQNSGSLFPAQQNNNTGGGVGLFGGSQPKPGGLFASGTQNTGGGMFGGNTSGTQSNGNSLFGASQQQQSGGGLFASSFGNSQQGQQMQHPPASINDSPFGSAFFNSSQQNSPLGPIATPLGSSQTKKAAMIPHHKIAPRQPSLTPRLGNSFSRTGSPFSSSSSTPLGGSGSLGRSFSTSNRLSLLGGGDDILDSNAFTPNGSSRVASLKKLVIDKKLRDQDLFSNGSDVRDSPIDEAKGGATRGILKKSVSFDIRPNGSGDDLYSGGEPAARETKGATPTAEEMGFIRGSADRRRARDADSSPTTAASSSHADGEPAIGNEVSIIKDTEEERGRGTYWMVPSAQKLKTLPKEQLKRVIGLTIGRRGYGQVRFDNPVDLSTLPCDLESVPGTIVIFDVRVCTVYPDHIQKPPPGKGMNVPATITLEDCFPVSRNEREKIRDPEHPRHINHIRRLKNIKDTEFVDYLVNEGIWIFKVQHFTTYGLEDSDEEEEDEVVYNDSSILSSVPSEDTPTGKSIANTPSSFMDDDAESMDADVSGMDTTGGFDDTFDFKRMGSSRLGSSLFGSRSSVPGSFLGSDGIEEEEEFPSEESMMESTMEEQSFLGEGSVGTIDEEDEPAEPMSESEFVEESTIIAEADDTIDVTKDSALVVAETLISPVKDSPLKLPGNTPKTLPLGRDWTEQLNNTISPIKRRFGGEGFVAAAKTRESPTKRSVIEPLNYGLLDLANDLYGKPSSVNGSGRRDLGNSRKREYESPVMAKYRPESVRPTTKFPVMGFTQTSKRFDYDNLEDKDKAWRKVIRPCWGRDGTLIYSGDLEGFSKSSHGRNDDIQFAAFQYGIKNHALPRPLELQLRATNVKLDDHKVPVAEVDFQIAFQSFAQLPWSEESYDQHEKRLWHLASVLWDPVADSALPLQGRTPHQRGYMIEKYRKGGLSQFLAQLVEDDADKHCSTASTLEEAAFAHLSAHRVEQACGALLDAGDVRLATLMTMIGGGETVRENSAKQIEFWRKKGVLSEIPVPIRALYELLAGETCFSEGSTGPPEDIAPDFLIPEHFKLDWKRHLALKVWYGCYEDEGIEKAVAKYSADLERYPSQVPKPVIEQTLPNGSKRVTTDLLWGLLQLYADKSMDLENIFTNRSSMSTSLDYRLAWQLHTILAKRGIRGFSGDIVNDFADGEEELIAGNKSAEVTMDFSAELETAGLWEWAIFVAMHLVDSDSREMAIRSILGRHVDEVEIDEGQGGKLAFLEKTLLVPKNWIFEAKALQARNEGEHLLEAEYLLASQCWDEAHKTIIQRVAPEAVIAGDLDDLIEILGKFEDVSSVKKWNVGGQVYLDYVRLLDFMRTGHSGRRKSSIPVLKAESKGLPKQEDAKDVARRLLGSLKSVERTEFLQNVAVREMSGVVSSFVLKNQEMITEQAKVLQLPLSEDQYLKESMRLSVSYFKAKLQEAY